MNNIIMACRLDVSSRLKKGGNLGSVHFLLSRQKRHNTSVHLSITSGSQGKLALGVGSPIYFRANTKHLYLGKLCAIKVPINYVLQ